MSNRFQTPVRAPVLELVRGPVVLVAPVANPGLVGPVKTGGNILSASNLLTLVGPGCLDYLAFVHSAGSTSTTQTVTITVDGVAYPFTTAVGINQLIFIVGSCVPLQGFSSAVYIAQPDYGSIFFDKALTVDFSSDAYVGITWWYSYQRFKK